MKKVITKFMTAAALIMISIAANAQGGLTPLVGSTHVYSVTADDAANNTLAWTVSPATGYNINSGAATQQVNITWTTAGTYTVTFTETDAATGCATVKNATVVVSANTFDVSASNPVAVCNAADGQVNYTDANATTAITFTIAMTTANAAFNPNWEITFTLNPGTATLGTVTANNGTLSGTGPFTLTGISSASGNGTVDITMNVTGGIYTAQTVELAITSARELTYNTPDVDNTDWTAIQTINAIPQTSTITTD
jgi:hypothetical protein